MTPRQMVDEEDEDTLQAIDAGIRDVEAGRVVSIESVRGFLGQWMTESSSRKNLLRDS